MDRSALRGAYPFAQRVGGVWIPGAGWALSFWVSRLAGISRTLASLGMLCPPCVSWLLTFLCIMVELPNISQLRSALRQWT